MDTKRLKFVLCWHMHQPHYREGIDGAYRLPWVYLHGIKDYTDMAAHLEAHPQMRAVVNFAPVLLEQLDDYAEQLQAFLDDGSATGDPLLNLLAGVEPIPNTAEERAELVIHCRRCNAERMINPYKPFKVLLDWYDHSRDQRPLCSDCDFPLSYLDDQFYYDLLTWYHLAWLGSSLREDERVQLLMDKGHCFDADDRRLLLQIIHDALAGLTGRYAALAANGQVELSMSPYSHPIVPLLHDFANMRCAQPEAPAPKAKAYPGGEERSRWHMRRGIELFEKHFARKPRGVWLSEGGVSVDALKMLDEFDIRWTASGEGVWRNSCHRSGIDEATINSKRALFSPCQCDGHDCVVFFRDDGLSDLIGFEYSSWHAEDAAANFVSHLENIASFLGDEAGEHVVSVILDGENAWEYYPNNGAYFLDALYRALVDSEHIELATFDEVTDLKKVSLSTFCPGSWVYGSFSTWIGQPDKNRGWDLLAQAKQAFDRAVAEQRLKGKQLQRASRQLAICEGSDWFWWFGDYNPADSVSDFDRLYRIQLKRLYALIYEPAPAELEQPISAGGGNAENAGTMRRNV